MHGYFDHAATSDPKPACVLDAVRDALTTDNANPGRSGHSRALRAAHILIRARESVARMLGATDPMEIALQFNCTDALNLAIKGSLRPGDHAIATALDHNSVLRPLMGMRARGMIEVTVMEPGGDGYVIPEHIRRALQSNTRLVVVPHASNVTGQIQPVAAIGAMLADTDARYLIDGAQALGATDVDIAAYHCALYAFPGHKGLLGPQGTGGLYVRADTALAPLREGGTGSSSESTVQPDECPDRYESGTLNLPGIAGMGAGADYVRAHLPAIMETERACTRALLEGLRDIRGVTVYGNPDPDMRVGVVSFNIGDYASGQVADMLDQRGYQLRGGLHCAPLTHRHLGTLERGAVRASVGHATTADDVAGLLAAVSDIARQ